MTAGLSHPRPGGPPSRRITTRTLFDGILALRRDVRAARDRALIDLAPDHPHLALLQERVLLLRALEARLHAACLAEEAEAARTGRPVPALLVTAEPLSALPDDPQADGAAPLPGPRPRTPYWKEGQYA